jgi:hypothetical protein
MMIAPWTWSHGRGPQMERPPYAHISVLSEDTGSRVLRIQTSVDVAVKCLNRGPHFCSNLMKLFVQKEDSLLFRAMPTIDQFTSLFNLQKDD